MPLNAFLLPGDTITIDGDIRIQWAEKKAGGRRALVLISAKDHDVNLEKGNGRERVRCSVDGCSNTGRRGVRPFARTPENTNRGMRVCDECEEYFDKQRGLPAPGG